MNLDVFPERSETKKVQNEGSGFFQLDIWSLTFVRKFTRIIFDPTHLKQFQIRPEMMKIDSNLYTRWPSIKKKI